MFNITDLTKKSFLKFKQDTSIKVSNTQLDFKAGDLVQIVKVSKNGHIEINFLNEHRIDGLSVGINFFNLHLEKASSIVDPLWHDWTIKSMKSMPGMDGIAFHGNLYYKNKKVGSIHNSGDGGPDSFDFDNKTVRDIFRQNIQSYKTVLSEKDYFIADEFIGTFIMYMQGLITYEDHLKEIVASMKKFHEKYETQS